ncbi:MAG: head-tail connector protein [Ruminococcus sp.]|nr:head-tail connector protein [Ruminococcus sp.]
MKITLDEAKAYLRITYGDEDALISDFIKTAEKLVSDVGRLTPEQSGSDDYVVKTAMLYTIGYLNENRTNPDFKKLTLTLRAILFAHREGVI